MRAGAVGTSIRDAKPDTDHVIVISRPAPQGSCKRR